VLVLHIASDGDELRFRPDRLTCRADVRVKLYFHHTGKILSDPHDWVLLKRGTEARFIADTDRQVADVVIPPGDENLVLAATPLCGKGNIVSTTFTAPPAGRYLFVCSIPGHAATMRGVLTVTP
jgi:azurin